MKLAKEGRLKNWERSQWKRTRMKISTVHPATHTKYRSLPRQINWLQSRTQFQCCYKFARCASKAASPTIADEKTLNKLARQLKSQPVKLQFWPLTRPLTIIACPGAFYRHNEDGSSQRGTTECLSESRERSSKDGMTYGSLVDYESQKIKETVLSVKSWQNCICS